MTEHDQRDERREYDGGQLERAMLDPNPLAQFAQWLGAAKESQVIDPTAMTLATTSADGQPTARIVLLKHFDVDGFVFYTDYESEKGQALATNPKAELLFYWRELDRQVRIRGSVAPVDRATSSSYFASRPLESQVSALASHQSQVIASRAELEAQAERVRQQSSLTMPERWGGFCLVPRQFEFWQGRESRLHDRFRYCLPIQDRGQDWTIERLQP